MFRLTKLAAATVLCCSASGSASGVAPPINSRWVQRPVNPVAALKPLHAAILARGGDVKAAAALYENAAELGAKKAAIAPANIFLLGIIAGCHIAFGGHLALTVGGNIPDMKANNPGLQKLIFGLFGLPFGLFMILTAGGELFTGNTALVTAALIERKATLMGLLKNWSFSYAGNLIGSLLLAKLVMCAGLNSAPASAAAITVAKVSKPFMETFLKGVVCNWLVCMAVWVAVGASTLTDKFLAMTLPVSAFLAFGAEHSVANMFLLPLGLFSGASSTVSWGDIAMKNILPVTLGNIVGGAVCQAGLYSAVYGSLLK